MKKKTSLVLAAVMLFICCIPSFAAETKTSASGTIYGQTYYYEDGYFATDASVYNPSLSTMSLLMTSASFGSSYNNYEAPYRYLFLAFNELGFTNAEVNDDYKVKPSTDTMGGACAYKTISVGGKTYTLLAIVPRSVGYEAEWASNFTLGTNGEAQGFSESAKKVEDFANEYVLKYASQFKGELKIWVVGYSRGAAVANLVAGHITKAGKIGNVSVSKENIYGYTFETPAALSLDVVSISEARSYTNIHNIISSNDLVTKVAPSNWGFIRFGTDESVIPETRTAENEALFETALSYLPEYLAGYTSEGKRVFASELFQAKKINLQVDGYVENGNKTMGKFLDDLITSACIGVGSRYNYTYQVQDLLRLLTSEYLGEGYQSNAWAVAKASLKAQLKANESTIISLALSGREIELTRLLTSIINETINVSGLDAEAYGGASANLVALIPVAVKTAIADVAIDGGNDIVTLIDNLDVLFNPHYSAQVLAWLMALDTKYTEAANAARAQVTSVQVSVTKKTTTKKVLFVKVTTTSYDVEITPVAGASVQKVEYRTLRIGGLKSGTSFNQTLKPSYLYISVTDANGNVTHWEYNGSTTTQVK